jgi:OOP family OmpA-OmpF porin
MRKRIICTLAAATIISATTAFAGVKAGSFEVTPLVGGYISDGGKYLDPTLILGARAGYNFTKHIGIEALYDYAASTDGKSGTPKDITMHRFGGQALYHFFPNNKFVPYLAAGYSGVKYEGNSVTNKVNGALDYGVGAKYFLADDFALRGDVRHILYNMNTTRYNDLEFTLGAYIQFGGAKPPVKAVAAPVPAPTPAPTPAPVKVAPAPVPTPEPVKVVVPPADSDRDGVIDALDQCPGTPAGVSVNSKGCPVDSDNDGVADYLDKCPSTPAGVAVDTKGCPVDSDNDGVADYLDKCPNTPAGVVVDAKGCAVEAAKRFCDKPAVVEIEFDTNKSEVKAKYHDELDKIGSFLKEFPGSKGTIEGHTDADGNKNANLKLSQARAESVRKYIISKYGIDGTRIAAKGYGPAKPVASNKTAAGKAKNRRIEAVFSCE